MGELDSDDQAGLPDLDDPVGVFLLQPGERFGPLLDRQTGHGLLGQVEYGRGDPAPQFCTSEGRHMRPAVALNPGAGSFAEQSGRDRVDAPRQPLAGDQDVRHHAEVIHRPHLPAAAEAGLHLVGDVQGAGLIAELAHGWQILGIRPRESGGGRHRLQDHRGGGFGKGSIEGVDVVESDPHEIGFGGQEGVRGLLVACGQRKPRVSVIRVDHGHDAAATGRTPGRLDGNVDGLPSATGKDRVVGTGRDADQAFGQRGTFRAGEMMVADVEGFQGRGQ